jgi:hypothetical protein
MPLSQVALDYVAETKVAGGLMIVVGGALFLSVGLCSGVGFACYCSITGCYSIGPLNIAGALGLVILIGGLWVYFFAERFWEWVAGRSQK